VRTSPLIGSRAGAAMAALLLLACAVPRADAASALKKALFTYQPPGRCERVYLAGEFNGWSTDATPMEVAGTRFEVMLPLAPGRYQYKFVADGRWITDETAREFHPDGYGGQNSVIVVDESFPDLAFSRDDGSVTVQGLKHSQNARELSASGAGAVTVGTRAWANDVGGIELVLRDERGDARLPMLAAGSDGTFDYYAVDLAGRAGTSFDYRFRLHGGAASAAWLGPLGASADETAVGWYGYEPGAVPVFETPAWVKEGVLYQIFPERFANGDPSNDPDFAEWYYEGARELPPSGKTNGEYFHLVRDWSDVAGLSEAPHKTDGKPDWNSFYGGDIEGVRANLDYLSDLGVTVLYFNPLFEAKSNHKYDAATFNRIDPHFATNDEFAAFVRECHTRGIRVVIDLAINHTGHTFWAFTDARRRGETSPTWDWYEWASWPVPGDLASTPASARDYYDCWWGHGQMPNLNFDLSRPNAEEQGVRRIEDASPNWPLVEHLLSASVYWLTEADVDGFRLDVAGEVPFWFWELFRDRVKRVKPDAYIVGELWGSSPEWVNGRYYDAVMNYKFFRDPVLDFIAKGATDAAMFDRALAPGRFVYPDEGVRAMMNLIDSHDTERFLTTAGGDLRKLKLAFLFMMTYVGAPTIYYGDEVAMDGAHDPDCRRPFPWTWQAESGRAEVREFVRSLAGLRGDLACLTGGSFATLIAEGRVYAYRRALGTEEAVVVLNAGGERVTATVPLGGSASGEGPAGRRFVSAFTGERVETAEDGRFEVELPPFSGVVLVGTR